MAELDSFRDRTYNFPPEVWRRAQTWLRHHLRTVAKERGTTHYGEVCDLMRAHGVIDLDPHGTPFAALLGQINCDEDDEGKPLISAVVLLKDSERPGVGFWNIARDLGYDVGETDLEREAFWINAFEECRSYWKDRRL